MAVQSTLLLLTTITVSALATWTMSGYACQQPQLYNQCQCPSFCSGYSGGYNSQPYIYPQYQSQYSRYQEFVSKHKPKHRKRPHPKKFKFSEETDSLEDFDSSEIKLKTTTKAPRTTTNSWDNEDLWEKKFVKAKGDEEEFPEITSSEIEATRGRVQPAPVGSGQGIGVNTGLGIGAPGIGGGGLGTGGLVGVSSGLGIGIPGVGPIGISSGLGIGK